MTRMDQYQITVSVTRPDDTPYAGLPAVLGVFDTFEGGEISANGTKYRAGAMADEEALGGPQTIGNVTVTREYVLERDHNIAHALKSTVGRGKIVVTKQPLDDDKNAYGRPLVYTGKVDRVQFPNSDSTSADVGKLEIEMVCSGSIG